jgi:tRNA-dihydrouridine synthase
VNIAATRALAEAVGIPVIASGGIGSLADIEALLPCEPSGVVAVIVGPRTLHRRGGFGRRNSRHCNCMNAFFNAKTRSAKGECLRVFASSR